MRYLLEPDKSKMGFDTWNSDDMVWKNRVFYPPVHPTMI